MAHFFEKRDRWGNGRALWVLVAMVFFIPPAFWALKQIRLENDVAGWLPDNDREAKVLKWYRELFPGESHLVISWRDSSLQDPRVEALAANLRGTLDADAVRRNGCKYVASVITPQDVIDRMVEHDVSRDEALRRLTGVLIGPGGLKVQLTDAGRTNIDAFTKLVEQGVQSKLGFAVTLRRPVSAASMVARFASIDDEPDQAHDEGFADEGFADDESADGLLVDETAEETFVDETTDEMQSGDALAEETSAEGFFVDETTIAAKAFDLEIVSPEIRADGTLAERLRNVILTLDATAAAQRKSGKWIADCFTAPGSPVAISVTLNEGGIAEERAAVEAVRQATLELGLAAEDIALGGSVIAATELNRAVKKAGWNRDVPAYQFWARSPLVVSCLIALVLSFWMLKSLRLALLVLLVTLYTVLVTVALVPVTGGSMNMVLVVMPTLLMVITVSSGIHVANYWKHAAHTNLASAVVESAKLSREPVLLAALTSALGQMSLMVSPLMPVRDFGLYGGIGCLVSMIVVLYCLPALLQYWPAGRPAATEVDSSRFERFGASLARHHKSVWMASIALSLVCTGGLYWFRTETKVIRYFPEHARIVRDYRFLESEVMGIVPMDIIVRFDQPSQGRLNFLERMEIVRSVEEEVRRHREISGAVSLADFQPVSQIPVGATGWEQMKFHKRANTMEDRIKQGRARGVSSFIATPAAGSEFHNAGDELWRITVQASLLSNVNYQDLTRELDAQVNHVLADTPGATHVLTGLVPVFMRTQVVVLDSLVSSFGVAFATIGLVMIILSRSVIAGALTMIPNLLPLGIVFGLISWFGIPVDIGTMISASVGLGLAVDGTMHFLTWFRQGIRSGLSRNASIAKAMGHCAPAMWQTAAVVGIGMLMLYPTELLLVSRFGWLMAALTLVAVAADLILLPAMLAGTLGRLLENLIRKEKQRGSTKNDATLAPPHFDRVARRLERVVQRR